MKIKLQNLDGSAGKGDIELSDDVFGLEPRADILHRVVTWQLENRRGIARATRERSDVARTGKKLGNQKGGSESSLWALTYEFNLASKEGADAFQSFVLEFLLTLILMFVILSVSTGSKEKGVLAGVAAGSVIALEALFAGPISGASMNPARSLAPALVSLRLDDLWVYLTAPVLGACVGVLACRCVQEPGCCCQQPPCQAESILVGK
jgi:hypothetical protein